MQRGLWILLAFSLFVLLLLLQVLLLQLPRKRRRRCYRSYRHQYHANGPFFVDRLATITTSTTDKGRGYTGCDSNYATAAMTTATVHWLWNEEGPPELQRPRRILPLLLLLLLRLPVITSINHHHRRPPLPALRPNKHGSRATAAAALLQLQRLLLLLLALLLLPLPLLLPLLVELRLPLLLLLLHPPPDAAAASDVAKSLAALSNLLCLRETSDLGHYYKLSIALRPLAMQLSLPSSTVWQVLSLPTSFLELARKEKTVLKGRTSGAQHG